MGACHGWPVIVKPSDSSASAGVFRVDGPDDAAEACRRVAQLRDDQLPEGVLDRFLVEEYVNGPEFSVEAVSVSGEHVVLAITEKLLAEDSFVEIGHALPARLDGVVERRLAAATMAFLDAMGLRDGPSHTEFRLENGMPRVIESHDRVGGDRIHDLVEAVCGVDQDRFALGWPFGLAPAPRSGLAPSCGAATRFFDSVPGEVVAIEGVEEVAGHPSVIALEVSVQVGDVVRPLRSSWDRVGQVAVRAATTADALALAERLASRVHVVTR
jgi:biotin carboxylase